jgi:hypothetical protein
LPIVLVEALTHDRHADDQGGQVRSPNYRPDDPDGEVYHGIQAAAWTGCIDWASRTAEPRRDYEAETGMVAPGANANLPAISRMIDEACGRTDPLKFMAWVSIRLYGLSFAPEKFQARVREMHAAGMLPWWDGVDNSTAEDRS